VAGRAASSDNAALSAAFSNYQVSVVHLSRLVTRGLSGFKEPANFRKIQLQYKHESYYSDDCLSGFHTMLLFLLFVRTSQTASLRTFQLQKNFSKWYFEHPYRRKVWIPPIPYPKLRPRTGLQALWMLKCSYINALPTLAVRVCRLYRHHNR